MMDCDVPRCRGLRAADHHDAVALGRLLREGWPSSNRSSTGIVRSRPAPHRPR